MIAVGDQAPSFHLPDQEGQTHDLSQYAGKWLLLYFYPKDDTSGCTIEACSFRDALGEFQKAGVSVLGVSADTVESHASFADKHQLPFPLLADTHKEAVNAYGVWREKEKMRKKYMGIVRVSFLIGPDGKIVKIYDPVDPEGHAKQVLEDVKKISENDG